MARIIYPGIKGKDVSLHSPNHKELLSQEIPGVKKQKKIKVITNPVLFQSQKPTGIQRKEVDNSQQALNAREEQFRDNGKKEKERKVFRVKI